MKFKFYYRNFVPVFSLYTGCCFAAHWTVQRFLNFTNCKVSYTTCWLFSALLVILPSQYSIKLRSTFCELLNQPQATHSGPVPHFTIVYQSTCYLYDHHYFTASSSITVGLFHITVVYPTTQYPTRNQHCYFDSPMGEGEGPSQSTVPHRRPLPLALRISPSCTHATFLTSHPPLDFYSSLSRTNYLFTAHIKLHSHLYTAA